MLLLVLIVKTGIIGTEFDINKRYAIHDNIGVISPALKCDFILSGLTVKGSSRSLGLNKGLTMVVCVVGGL